MTTSLNDLEWRPKKGSRGNLCVGIIICHVMCWWLFPGLCRVVGTSEIAGVEYIIVCLMIGASIGATRRSRTLVSYTAILLVVGNLRVLGMVFEIPSMAEWLRQVGGVDVVRSQTQKNIPKPSRESRSTSRDELPVPPRMANFKPLTWFMARGGYHDMIKVAPGEAIINAPVGDNWSSVIQVHPYVATSAGVSGRVWIRVNGSDEDIFLIDEKSPSLELEDKQVYIREESVEEKRRRARKKQKKRGRIVINWMEVQSAEKEPVMVRLFISVKSEAAHVGKSEQSTGSVQVKPSVVPDRGGDTDMRGASREREQLQPSDDAYKIGPGITPPKLLYKIEPDYTQEAKQARIQGTVALKAKVSVDGRPEDIIIVKSLDPGLDSKAIDAVKQWRFKPGMRDGTPIPVWVTIEVHFKLL